MTCLICGQPVPGDPRAKTCSASCRKERERRRSAARYPRERTARLQRQSDRNRVPDPGVLLARIVAEMVEEPPLRVQFPEMPRWEERSSFEGFCQDLAQWARGRLGR